jgi:probable phosphoglycerate mutase
MSAWSSRPAEFRETPCILDATRIIAMRHGETAWNVDTRIQGQLDIPLNDTRPLAGQRVAAALATKPSTPSTPATCSARMPRHSAIGQASGVEPVGLTGLRERGFGVFQGKTFAEIEATWPD